MGTLSVVLATYNEEINLPKCLASIKDFADEIVIVDGSSTDRTVEVAKSFGAKVVVTENQKIFHINKQKALELAGSQWILQLDADEVVSPELGKEIKKIIAMTDDEIEHYQTNLKNRELFLRHTALLEKRDGNIGTKEGKYNAFFIPRLNYFLGKFLRYGGVYPDGVIRLVKKNKARFPAKDVHEQITVDGKVGWIQHDLLHYDSPTFARYIKRWNRYTTLLKDEFQTKHTEKNLINSFRYLFVMPVWWFLLMFLRHKGFLDGWQGFVFSFFSALRFSAAYLKFVFARDPEPHSTSSGS